jgi:hypothetical protein
MGSTRLSYQLGGGFSLVVHAEGTPAEPMLFSGGGGVGFGF